MKPYVALIALLLAGCGTTAASISYAPTGPVQNEAAPNVATVTVVDQRDEKDPVYIGAVRGGFGNPLKTLVSARPIKDEVGAAMIAGLRARGLYGDNGPDALAVTLTAFSANQMSRREAQVAFTMALVRRSDGRTLYQRAEAVDKINGSMITFDAGVFASVDDLRAIMAQALDQAVDQALDRPGFLTAVRSQ